MTITRVEGFIFFTIIANNNTAIGEYTINIKNDQFYIFLRGREYLASLCPMTIKQHLHVAGHAY